MDDDIRMLKELFWIITFFVLAMVGYAINNWQMGVVFNLLQVIKLIDLHL